VDPDAEGLAVLDVVDVGDKPAAVAVFLHLDGLEDLGIRIGVPGALEEVLVGDLLRIGALGAGTRFVVEDDVARLRVDGAGRGAEGEKRGSGHRGDVGGDAGGLPFAAEGSGHRVGEAEIGFAFDFLHLGFAEFGVVAGDEALDVGQAQVDA